MPSAGGEPMLPILQGDALTIIPMSLSILLCALNKAFGVRCTGDKNEGLPSEL